MVLVDIIRMEELIFMVVEVKKTTFVEIGFIKLDIYFMKNN